MMWRIFAGVDRTDFAGIEYFADGADAWQYAMNLACDQYDCLHGIDGIRSIYDIMDEDNIAYDEAYAKYQLEREKRIEYKVELYV